MTAIRKADMIYAAIIEEKSFNYEAFFDYTMFFTPAEMYISDEKFAY